MRILRLLLHLVPSLAVTSLAQAFTVTSLSDSGPAAANDGTLRGAVIAANAGAGGDTIDFNIPAGGTITLTGGELLLTKSVTITGPSAANIVISGNSNRIFNISTGITVGIARLKLTSATAPSGSSHGGAILNAGSLTLTECWLKDCAGGAGTTQFSPGVNGGAGGSGGGVASSGTLSVTGCTFDNCRAGYGGGGGPAFQATSTRGGNGGAGGSGGAAWISAGSASFTNCTFYNCSAGNGGTGGSGYSSGSFGSGGSGGNGGAVANGGGGSLQLTSCTFDLTSPGSGGSGLSFPGPYGQGSDVYGPAVVRNSLMATSSSAATGFANAVTSVGFNLFGQGEAQVRLASLAANGGPTPTCALLPGSPALEAGDPALSGTDQRGSARPSGAGVDVGAFEYAFSGGGAPVVMTGTPAPVAQTSATVNGTVNANGLATTVVIEYGTTTSYGLTSVPAFSPNNGVTAQAVGASLTGLTANSTYHYRITATNAGGITRSADATFATLPNAPYASTYAATAVAANAATLNGNVSPQGDVTTVWFELGTTVSYGTTITSSVTPNNGTSFYNVSASASSLVPGTLYHYRVAASNAGGTTYGADQTFTTQALNNANLSALSLSGIVLSPVFASGTTSYTASVSSGTASTTVTPTTASSGATVKVNGVSQASGTASAAIVLALGGNTITIEVTAQDGITVKTYTVTVTRASPPVAPSVSTGGASAVTDTAASIGGTINANGSSTTGFVDYGLTTSYGTTVSTSPSTLTGSTAQGITASLSGLQPNTTYHYRVRGVNANGTTNGSDATFTTLTYLPSATMYPASGITATTVRLSAFGSPNVTAATGVIEYGLTPSYGTTTTVENFTAGNSHIFDRDISGLLPGTLYHARVSITNAAGTAYSSDITFTTGSSTSTNADLASVSATFGTPTGSIINFPPSPAFASNVTSYTVAVDQAGADFNVTASDPAAAVFIGLSNINGTTAPAPGRSTYASVSGMFGASITTTVTVEVHSPGGTAIKTYTFVFFKPSAPVVNGINVSSVTSSGATLSGSYTPGVGSADSFQFLVWDTPGNAPSPTVTRQAGDSTTCVMTGLAANTLYNYRFGAFNTTGASSLVTTFTTAAIPGSALLSTLGGGPFTPAFSSTVFSYTRIVPVTTTSIALVPVMQDSAATLSINGQATNQGSTRTINLVPGSNVITIHCVASGGGTQDYTINVQRQAAAIPQSSWRQTFFGSTANSGSGADLADPDGDGIPNILEWACGANPNASDAFTPVLQRASSNLQFTYTRSSGAAAAGATFVVECSTSLASNDWHSTGISQTILADDGTTQTVRADVPANSVVCFVRLRVVVP